MYLAQFSKQSFPNQITSSHRDRKQEIQGVSQDSEVDISANHPRMEGTPLAEKILKLVFESFFKRNPNMFQCS